MEYRETPMKHLNAILIAVSMAASLLISPLASADTKPIGAAPPASSPIETRVNVPAPSTPTTMVVRARQTANVGGFGITKLSNPEPLPVTMFSTTQPARAGVNLPVWGLTYKGQEIAQLGFLYGANVLNWSDNYQGFTIQAPLYKDTRFQIYVVGSWSANWQKLTNPAREAWSIGFGVKF